MMIVTSYINADEAVEVIRNDVEVETD